MAKTKKKVTKKKVVVVDTFKKQMQEERAGIIREILDFRTKTKKTCPHLRTNADGSFQEGNFNVKWAQHADKSVLGVCGTCFSPLDARNPEDLDILLQDPRAISDMARVNTDKPFFEIWQTELVKPVTLSWWEKFCSLFKFN